MSTTKTPREFEFETVEKLHAEIEPTDQIVGVRIDGELVAVFRADDGKDWIPGSFYDGEGLDEDRTGSRTFVVRAEPVRARIEIDADGLAKPVRLDYCPECGRRISDDDENAIEDGTGQRSCLWHEGDPIYDGETLPGLADLERCETMSVGWNADLKVNTGDFRLWLARTGLDDGEPYERTVYVEAHHDVDGWLDLGHYDAEAPPRGLPGVTPHAFRGEVGLVEDRWDTEPEPDIEVDVEVCPACVVAAFSGETLDGYDGREPLGEVPDGFDLVDVDEVEFFSPRRCQTCGGLAGARYEGTLVRRETAAERRTRIAAIFAETRPSGTLAARIARRREDRARAARESAVFADVAGTTVVRDRGFFLVELLVVIALIGILAVPLSGLMVSLVKTTAATERAASRLAYATSAAAIVSRVPVSNPCSTSEYLAAVRDRLALPDEWTVEVAADVECVGTLAILTVSVEDARGDSTELLAVRS